MEELSNSNNDNMIDGGEKLKHSEKQDLAATEQNLFSSCDDFISMEMERKRTWTDQGDSGLNVNSFLSIDNNMLLDDTGQNLDMVNTELFGSNGKNDSGNNGNAFTNMEKGLQNSRNSVAASQGFGFTTKQTSNNNKPQASGRSKNSKTPQGTGKMSHINFSSNSKNNDNSANNSSNNNGYNKNDRKDAENKNDSNTLTNKKKTKSNKSNNDRSTKEMNSKQTGALNDENLLNGLSNKNDSGKNNNKMENIRKARPSGNAATEGKKQEKEIQNKTLQSQQYMLQQRQGDFDPMFGMIGSSFPLEDGTGMEEQESALESQYNLENRMEDLLDEVNQENMNTIDMFDNPTKSEIKEEWRLESTCEDWLPEPPGMPQSRIQDDENLEMIPLMFSSSLSTAPDTYGTEQPQIKKELEYEQPPKEQKEQSVSVLASKPLKSHLHLKNAASECRHCGKIISSNEANFRRHEDACLRRQEQQRLKVRRVQTKKKHPEDNEYQLKNEMGSDKRKEHEVQKDSPVQKRARNGNNATHKKAGKTDEPRSPVQSPVQSDDKEEKAADEFSEEVNYGTNHKDKKASGKFNGYSSGNKNGNENQALRKTGLKKSSVGNLGKMNSNMTKPKVSLSNKSNNTSSSDNNSSANNKKSKNSNNEETTTNTATASANNNNKINHHHNNINNNNNNDNNYNNNNNNNNSNKKKKENNNNNNNNNNNHNHNHNRNHNIYNEKEKELVKESEKHNEVCSKDHHKKDQSPSDNKGKPNDNVGSKNIIPRISRQDKTSKSNNKKINQPNKNTGSKSNTNQATDSSGSNKGGIAGTAHRGEKSQAGDMGNAKKRGANKSLKRNSADNLMTLERNALSSVNYNAGPKPGDLFNTTGGSEKENRERDGKMDADNDGNLPSNDSAFSKTGSLNNVNTVNEEEGNQESVRRRDYDLLNLIRRLESTISTLDVTARVCLRDALVSLSNKAATGGGATSAEQEAMNRAAEYLVLRMLFLSGPQVSTYDGSNGGTDGYMEAMTPTRFSSSNDQVGNDPSQIG